jgi:hypothetical protein
MQVRRPGCISAYVPGCVRQGSARHAPRTAYTPEQPPQARDLLACSLPVPSSSHLKALNVALGQKCGNWG